MSRNIIEKTKEKLAKYENRHNKIIETAIGIFNARGYAATTTSRIARKAGVSERALYRHFKNKEGIFSECLFSIIGELTKIWQNELGENTGDGLDYLEAFTSSYVNFVKNNPDKSLFLVHLYTYRDDPGIDAWFKKFIHERLDEAKNAIISLKEKSVIKSDIDPRVLAGIFIGQYFSIVFLSEFVEPELLKVDTAIELVKNVMKID